MNEIIRFKKEDTILVVIDMQEKLMPAMYNREKTEEQNIRLAKGCLLYTSLSYNRRSAY